MVSLLFSMGCKGSQHLKKYAPKPPRHGQTHQGQHLNGMKMTWKPQFWNTTGIHSETWCHTVLLYSETLTATLQNMLSH